MAIRAEVITDLVAADLKCTSFLTEPFIGLDCEGVNLGPKGEISLVQVAGMYANVIFDILTCPDIMKGKLKTLLEHQEVIKIIHDCRNDKANLKNQFEIDLNPVFDTQIANKVIHPSAPQISLNQLCDNYQFGQNVPKDMLHGMFVTNPEFWKTRPLTQEMIEYAAVDVIHLRGLYGRMNPKIKRVKKGNAKFKNMCKDA